MKLKRIQIILLFLVIFLIGNFFIGVKALDEPSGWSYGWYSDPNYTSQIFGNATLLDNKTYYESTVHINALSPYIVYVKMQNYTGGGIFEDAFGTVHIKQATTGFNDTTESGTVSMMNGTFSFAIPNVMGGAELYQVIDIQFQYDYNQSDFIYCYHWMFDGATSIPSPSPSTLLIMMNILIDIFLIGVPAFLFGGILGFSGVLFGLVIGSGLAVNAGIIPVWICILFAFVMFLIVFMGRKVI